MPVSKNHSLFIVLIIVACFLAYLPMSTFFLANKNDFFTGYFPVKYFLSQSLDAYEIPVWNPFLNYGFPIYGDMSSSYWNIATWVFAAFGYTPFSFTFELLLYLLLSGYGMYLVAGIWIKDPRLKYVFALCYMCSGFNVGHLQHFNWVTASSMLPFCFYFFWKMITAYDKYHMLAAVFFFSFFITSVHPGMIIGAGYFFGIIGIILSLKKTGRTDNLLRLLIFVLLLSLVCSGMFWGYLDVLPQTNRSGPVSVSQMIGGSTDPASWISWILPFVITGKEHLFSNDISLRNCYMGILPFAAIISYMFQPGNRLANLFIITGIGFLILSTSFFPEVYSNAPLLKFVRLRGEFRLFALFSFLLAAMQLSLEPGNVRNRLITVLKVIRLLLIIAVTISLYFIIIRKNSFLFQAFNLQEPLLPLIKSLLYKLSLADKFTIQGILQVILISLFVNELRRNGILNTWKFVSIELILVSLMNMPFTGVGKTTLKEIDLLVSKAPKGQLEIYTIPESNATINYPETDSLIGSWSFYGRTVAQDKFMLYPLVLKDTKEYFESGEQKAMLTRSFAFTEKNAPVIPVHGSYNTFIFRILSAGQDTLTVKQNLFPGWKAYLNGRETPVFLSHKSMLGTNIPPGSNTITLEYRNKTAVTLLITHLIIMLALAILLIVRFYRIRYILP